MGIISEVRGEIKKPENASKYVQPTVVFDGFAVELYNKRAKRRNLPTLPENAAPQAIEEAVNSFKYEITRFKKIRDPDHKPKPGEKHKIIDKEYKVNVDEGVAIIRDIIGKHPEQAAANVEIANQLNQKTKQAPVLSLTKNQVFELIHQGELPNITTDTTDKLNNLVGYPANPQGDTIRALFATIGPLSEQNLINSRFKEVPFFSRPALPGHVEAARAEL